jgi:hypothetical protein
MVVLDTTVVNTAPPPCSVSCSSRTMTAVGSSARTRWPSAACWRSAGGPGSVRPEVDVPVGLIGFAGISAAGRLAQMAGGGVSGGRSGDGVAWFGEARTVPVRASCFVRTAVSHFVRLGFGKSGRRSRAERLPCGRCSSSCAHGLHACRRRRSPWPSGRACGRQG